MPMSVATSSIFCIRSMGAYASQVDMCELRHTVHPAKRPPNTLVTCHPAATTLCITQGDLWLPLLQSTTCSPDSDQVLSVFNVTLCAQFYSSYESYCHPCKPFSGTLIVLETESLIWVGLP